ncbi:MAG: O-antigen ligase family protein [Candidatus Competibacteraceae bacterium]|nr:MAG: O-antigen ligase family protein [Candidatus Competibacteraceae bacterium]
MTHTCNSKQRADVDAHDIPVTGGTLIFPPRRPMSRPLKVFRFLTSPAAAFLLLFPTIGYYTFAAYVNVIFPEGSVGNIVIRAGSLVILSIAFTSVRARQKKGFNKFLLPVTIFLFFYTLRLVENILFSDIEIIPGNNTLVLMIFFFSSIIPAYVLAFIEPAIRDEDMVALLSGFAILFLVGVWLNREALAESAEVRMMLTKINPISLSYVAVSFILYYLIQFSRSKRVIIEALLITPVLLVIISLARSRGAMISGILTLIIYILITKGSRRISMLVILGGAVTLIALFANPIYLESAMDALNRIDTHDDLSTKGRILSFEGAWEQFLENPLIGRYAIELQTGVYSHNILLDSLMSVGLIGSIPFALHIGLALRATIGIIRNHTDSFAHVFIALLFIRDFIGSQFSGSLWGSSGFWITSFIVISIWYGRKRNQLTQRVIL